MFVVLFFKYTLKKLVRIRESGQTCTTLLVAGANSSFSQQVKLLLELVYFNYL